MHGAKRERILRVLLNRPDGTLTKYRIAKLSDSSTSWTIEFLKNLEKEGYVKGTKVVKKKALLEYWVSITRKPVRYEFFVQSPTELLKDVEMEYALTTYMAENLLNHHLFPTRTDIYIHKADLLLWKEKLSEKGLYGKGNLRLLVGDNHVFYKKSKIKSLWVASIPQVLVDLKIEGGVCEEAYDMMVEKYVRRK